MTGSAPPDAGPDTGAGQDEPERAEVRLRMKPNRAARGYVDGAWWPRSHNPTAEFPGLILAMSSWVGPVRRVSYHLNNWNTTARELTVHGWSIRLAGVPTLDANTIVVTGSNQKSCWWFRRAHRATPRAPCWPRPPGRTPWPASRRSWRPTASGGAGANIARDKETRT